MPYTDCWVTMLQDHKKMERELVPNTKSQHNLNYLYGYLQSMKQPDIYLTLTDNNLIIPQDPGVQAIYPPGTTDI